MHCMALPCCDNKLPKPNTFIQQIGVIITSARRLGSPLFVCLSDPRVSQKVLGRCSYKFV